MVPYHFLDINKMIYLIGGGGLFIIDFFLILFRVKRKINVWGFRAKGGELFHLNTNRLSGAI